MGRRTNVLVVAGIAAFVVGLAIVLLLNSDDDGTGSGSGTNVDVLVARQDIPANTKGDDAIALVEVKRVSASDRLADALSTPSQLSNTVFTVSFKAGEQIRAGGVRSRGLVASLPVPEGKEAVSVAIPFVQGGAGYIVPGDFVNIYQLILAVPQLPDAQAPNAEPLLLPFSTPRAELLLSNIQVLDVQTQVAPLTPTGTATATQTTQPTSASRAASGLSNITVVLALDIAQSEQVILGSSVQGWSLYLSRINDKNPPASDTGGIDPTQLVGQ